MALNHEDLGRIYASRGSSDEAQEKAEAEWDEAVDLFEFDGVALSGLARIAEDRNDFDEAAEIRMKLFEADRERSDLLLLLADGARSAVGAKEMRARWGTWARLQTDLFADPAVLNGFRSLRNR